MFITLCKQNFADKTLHLKYKKYRNLLTRLQDKAKINYYRHSFNVNKNDSTNTWKLINEIINQKNTSKFPSNIRHYNTSISCQKSICDILNNHFVNVGPNLAKSIPSYANSSFDYLCNRISNSIFLDDTDPEEISKIISSLNIKKAVGPDGISSKILHILKSVISPVLSNIINKSMQLGIFPDKLKIAKIIPLHKGGKIDEINNYRPISILSSLSKIFEKVINKRFIDFLKKHNVISDYQFGFREGMSTTLALADICDQFQNALDNNEITCGIFIDLAKAFDTVNHSILLKKLIHYGIRGNAFELIKSYLNDRVQYVQINNFISSNKEILCGVPQGSVLGPLLFLLYVNDIQNASDFNIRLFADDTLLYFSKKKPCDLEKHVNIELDKIQRWLDVNKLSLNVSKTKYIIISPKLRERYKFQIKLKEHLLCQTETHKYLGIVIDEKLSWKPHLSAVASKLAKLCGLFYKLRLYVDKQVLRKVYYTLIYPILLYGVICWGSCSKTVSKPVEVVHNRILRCINMVGKRQIHVTDLYALSNVLKIHDIYILEICKFMFRFKHDLLPNVFSKYFSKHNSIHNYNTRNTSKSNYFLPRKKKTIGQRTLQYRGVKYWNELPDLIKSSCHIYAFSKQLKKYLITSYK